MSEEIMMGLHDLSVSGDRQAECVARLMKQTVVGSLDWLDDERQRGTDPLLVIEAMIRAHVGIANIISAHAINVRQDTMEAMGRAYGVAFSSYAEAIGRADTELNKRRRQP